jgi:excisionase family DNA binding protein
MAKKRIIEPMALRIEDAARYLGISEATARKLLKEGKLESFTINERGDRRVPITALKKFMRVNAFNAGIKAIEEASGRKVRRRVKNLFDNSVKDTEKDVTIESKE